MLNNSIGPIEFAAESGFFLYIAHEVCAEAGSSGIVGDMETIAWQFVVVFVEGDCSFIV